MQTMSFNKTVKAEYVQMLLLVAGTDDLSNAVIDFYMCLTCGRLANVDPFDAVDFLENVAKYGKNARKETVDSAMHRRLRVYIFDFCPEEFLFITSADVCFLSDSKIREAAC